jgi:hypothetical protein
MPRPTILLFVCVAFTLHNGCSKRGLPPGSDRRRFDPVDWKAEHSSDFRGGGVSVRKEMLHDLVTDVLPGKTRSEIEAILGPSLDTPYFRTIKKDFIYYLGPERGYGINIDSEWLLLWLDATGHYHHYRVVND